MENKFDIKKVVIVTIVIGAIVGIVTIVKRALGANEN
jgi:hypothetical protein